MQVLLTPWQTGVCLLELLIISPCDRHFHVTCDLPQPLCWHWLYQWETISCINIQNLPNNPCIFFPSPFVKWVVKIVNFIRLKLIMCRSSIKFLGDLHPFFLMRKLRSKMLFLLRPSFPFGFGCECVCLACIYFAWRIVEMMSALR